MKFLEGLGPSKWSVTNSAAPLNIYQVNCVIIRWVWSLCFYALWNWIFFLLIHTLFDQLKFFQTYHHLLKPPPTAFAEGFSASWSFSELIWGWRSAGLCGICDIMTGWEAFSWSTRHLLGYFHQISASLVCEPNVEMSLVIQTVCCLCESYSRTWSWKFGVMGKSYEGKAMKRSLKASWSPSSILESWFQNLKLPAGKMVWGMWELWAYITQVAYLRLSI